MGQERHNPTGTSDLTSSFIFEESLLCPRCYACFRAEVDLKLSTYASPTNVSSK